MNNTYLPFLLILSLIACCIEVDISVPGFPDMAAYFSTSGGMIQLTIAYNFLGFCLASLFYGPLSECYGRRKIMIIGNAILLIGALGCVYATSIQILLISRFIQGVGVATSAVIAFAIIADIYRGKKSAKLIGIMNSVLTTLMAIALVAGGVINEAVGWRGNYGIVAAISLISWVLLFLMLPETKKNLQIFKPKTVLKNYARLLSNTKFISASLVPSLMFSAYMSFIACSAFLYIKTFGLCVMAYVLHQASIIASFAFVSAFSGMIIGKLGARKSIINGIALCGIGSLLLFILALIAPNSPYLTTSFMIIFCIGFAISYPIIFARSLEIFPEVKGVASSVIMSMRALLVSAFTGLTSYLYNDKLIVVALVILLAVILILVFTFHLLRSKFLIT